MVDPEAHVFLIRSIRRRLVLLFSVALGLILLLGAAGLQGLLWHLEAVDDLDFLLHASPDQDRLSRAVSRIGESLHTRLDPRKPGASAELSKSCEGCILKAQEELFEFRRRIEHLPFQSENDLRQRAMALGRLDAVYGEAARIEADEAPMEVAEGEARDNFIGYFREIPPSLGTLLDLVSLFGDLAEAMRGTLSVELEEFDPRVPLRDAMKQAAGLAEGVGLIVEEPVLAQPPMCSDRKKIARTLVTFLESAYRSPGVTEVRAAIHVAGETAVYRVSGGEGAPHAFGAAVANATARALGGRILADAAGGIRVELPMQCPAGGSPPVPDGV